MGRRQIGQKFFIRFLNYFEYWYIVPTMGFIGINIFIIKRRSFWSISNDFGELLVLKLKYKICKIKYNCKVI